MSFKFWALSSKEYCETLKSGEFSDTEILVGEVPDTKVFKLHSLILKVRSPYFRKALSGDKIKVENNIIKHEIPNISVKVFDILIKYIYNGTIDLTKNDLKTNIALLIAIGELHLNNLNSIISTHILKDQVSLKKNLVLIQHVTTKYAQFTGRLSGFYKTTIRQDPSMIFKTDDFVTINKDVLLNLVKNNKSLKQIEVWDKLKEWAIAQSRELPSDTEKWTSNEMTTFATTIKSFIPLINFKEISPADFSQKIKPFKNFGGNNSDLRLLKENTSKGQCYKNSYEKLIRQDEGIFEVDDFEVFQVFKKARK
ncbi:BTB/POZ domain-containing protein [Glomus cerebriforme]|uniref:BTB/POZ domain-containing protein n=1 Tax=Glomus cerebriforme TaxID=658196 RepID=A0A397RYT6_9GLOM|nr:BTB/POZ domain-containing protein [Glomus cerebriforme]RIA90998.1 BTB/POZ domain-containing protein [Glomus cerebriforme]